MFKNQRRDAEALRRGDREFFKKTIHSSSQHPGINLFACSYWIKTLVRQDFRVVNDLCCMIAPRLCASASLREIFTLCMKFLLQKDRPELFISLLHQPKKPKKLKKT